ncbi:MAG TPA: CDP-alcohol phosphatidyltransferase family protein [Candidatus Nanoarchaeia archaeon]|nr:CDP-alcohol phosphatidyltransferase family protein [Candidatus Nanoarchaeia archaeon]
MFTFRDIRKKSLKPICTFGERIYDPIAIPFVWFLANFTFINPYMVNFINFLSSILSGYFFFKGNITAGALLFALASLADFSDGKLARLKFKPSLLGMFTDLNGDKIRVLFPLIGLTAAYFNATNDISIFYWALIFLYTNLFFPFAEAYMYYQSMRRGLTDRHMMGSSLDSRKISKIRAFLQKRRVDLMYTTADQEQLIFLLFPLLSHLNFEFIKYGYILATVTYIVWMLLVRYPRQVRRIVSA